MMKDKIVLITGATGGIGKQTALTLARMGAQVIVTGRNSSSGQEAVAEIKQESGNPRIELLLADVSKQADIRALAGNFKAKYDRLDVLINNAGLAASTRQLTLDGIESNFAVNVVAPFLLTHLLMDSLKAGHSARVVNLMGGDVSAKLEMDNLQAGRSFDGLISYSQSKLAMMLTMYEFAQRTQSSKVTINICYPGQASTKMTRSVTPEMLPGGMRWLFPLFKLMTRPDHGKSAAKASQSSVYLASSPAVEGVAGKYFNSKCKEVPMPQTVFDSGMRQNLWEMVHQLAKLSE
jgi:NAD(P)-dependent dehydrogenase (short-subunit alcohol dehydrogenase family)